MRKRALPKSLWQPKLYWGCELIPWVFAAMTSGIIFMAAQTWFIRIAALVFGLLLMWIIRLINKKEPWAFKIISRYTVFQKYYLNIAKFPSRPYRPNNVDH